MRPINLKIQGINSYVSEQEICFDKLSESNLFGIFGDTGSGKTTILDAIIIALYGSSDREIMPNIINVNCKTAHIYFTFEVENGDKKETYLVKRDYVVRKSGVKTDAILLGKNDKVLAEQAEQVNEKILEIIGVGKKEFQKCIALPQGEFDRFLTDTPANRKKTIAKLFNLEMFGADLQEKIKIRKDKVTLKKLNVEDRLAMFDNVSEEQLEKLRFNLNENQKLLNVSEVALIEAREKFNAIKHDYEINTKVNDLKTKLGLLKAEESDIKYLKKQINYTQKYGQYILLFNKQTVVNTEIESMTDELLMDKKLLLSNEEKIKQTDSEISEKNNTYNNLKAKLNLINQYLEKYQTIKINQVNLQQAKEKLEEEIEEVSSLIKDLKSSVVEHKKLSDEQQNILAKLNKTIEDNNEILDKLKEVKTVKTVESFVDYLKYLKNLINPESLQEVYQFNIHKEVNTLIKSIDNYETKTSNDIAGLQQDYDALTRYNNDLDDLETNLQKANREYMLALEKTKANIDEAKNHITICNAKLDEKSVHVSTLKQTLRETTTKMKINDGELDKMVEAESYESLNSECEKLSEEVNQLNAYKQELLKERNELVVAIEVNMVQLENLKDGLNDINKEIKTLGVVVDSKDNLYDTNLYLNEENLNDAIKKVEDYEKNYELISKQISELDGERNNKKADLNMLQKEMENIQILEKKEKSYMVNIALCNQLIEQMKDNLIKVEQLNKEKDAVRKELNTVMELSNLTSNGKLLDYVSEEYMYLITQFSNNFVYKISKGKYMLRYSGEFFVVDNFNGGISRSVKTLSGGERFIISLSLALGISQSIAINNNRKFNFFFIDEGFGSLSEEYIETVLSSFDALIKLNFTVGFISHVERMQNFINNRIVVSKKSTEEGSIVKQYY